MVNVCIRSRHIKSMVHNNIKTKNTINVTSKIVNKTTRGTRRNINVTAT